MGAAPVHESLLVQELKRHRSKTVEPGAIAAELLSARAIRFVRAFVLWFALLYAIFIALYVGVGPLLANR